LIDRFYINRSGWGDITDQTLLSYPLSYPLHSRIRDRWPFPVDDGFISFGKAVPLTVIAQVSEPARRLRGMSGARQADLAHVELTINQDLFGHGPSIIAAS
jgi:hypothetical protein